MIKGVKKEMNKLFLVLILIFSLTCVSAATRSCWSCSNCTSEIIASNTGDIIQPNQSFLGVVEDCIAFNGKDNITFDCQGNSINGDAYSPTADYGIRLNISGGIGTNNSIIKNCNISGFYYGISVWYSYNNTLINTTVSDSLTYGVELIYSSNNRLANLTLINNSRGISLDSSNNNNITNINATKNVHGIYLVSSNRNIISNVNTSYNQEGIYLNSASYNNITNVTTNNNTLDGIFLYLSNYIDVSNIISNNNTKNGVYLYTTSNISLINITTAYNFQDGISVYSFSNSTFISNITSNNNVRYGIYLYYSNSTTIANSTMNFNSYGISAVSSSIITLSNLTIMNSTNIGIGLNNADKCTLTNLIVNGSRSYGITLYYSSNINSTNITTNFNDQGFRVESTNNSITTNLVSNNNTNYGVYLSDAFVTGGSYNFFSNVIVQENNLSDFGFYAQSANYCKANLSNVTGSGGFPIRYYNSSNLAIQNQTFSELILCNVDYSNINNITIMGSDSIPNNNLWVYWTDNSNFSNINVSHNYNGIYFYSSGNNSIINITANNNSYCGLDVFQSVNNTFSNINANYNNFGGVCLEYTSNYNTLTNSSIKNNLGFGLWLKRQSSSKPQYNLIYNNYFNNSINYNTTSVNMINYYNISKTSGTNIIGKGYVGGNFWAYPNGTGPSQICALDADGDYICDYNYTLDSLNYDYLPLIFELSSCVENWECTSWTTCLSETQSRLCIDLNSCGTTVYKPALSQSCTSGSGGGGGSSTTVTETVSSASPSSPAQLSISNPGIDLIKIVINVLEIINNPSVTVTKVEPPGVNFQIGLPSGESYQAFEISTTINSTSIANISLDFKVNKTWLENKNGTIEDVRLYRRQVNATEWNALTTVFVKEEAGYYYFSSLSPGFSTFVVFFGKYECQPGIKRCYERQSQLCLGNATWLITERCSFGCDESGECIKTAPQSVIIYTILIAVISVAIILTLYMIFMRIFKRKRR